MTNATKQINTTDTLSYLYSQHLSTPLQHGHGFQNNQHFTKPETRNLEPKTPNPRPKPETQKKFRPKCLQGICKIGSSG